MYNRQGPPSFNLGFLCLLKHRMRSCPGDRCPQGLMWLLREGV